MTTKSSVQQTDPITPFGPGSMMWEDTGNTLAMAVMGGAFILQVMHPAISAAIDEHSVYREDTAGRAQRSMDSVMMWVYGGGEAAKEGARLRELHKPIRGKQPNGKAYSALNPEAYAWVHGTAFVSAVTTHKMLRGRDMTAAEQAAYYEEILQLGDILHIRRSLMPATVEEYWDYYTTMVSERLEHTVIAEDLVQRLRKTKLGLLPGPLAWPGDRLAGELMYLLTIGGLPDDARQILGIRWSGLDQLRLEATVRVLRPLHEALPEHLRYAPLAYHARKYAREIEAVKRRQTVSVV